MKTALVFSAIVAGCTAFAPSASTAARSSATALAADLSGEIGAQAPLGFWDPLDMTNGGEKDTFDALREIELKHGRVAMLAVVGEFLFFVLQMHMLICDVPTLIEGKNKSRTT